MDHICHARGCTTKTHPRMFMCKKHWHMIPKSLQKELWAVYVPGQEISKNPTHEYLEVAYKLIDYVSDLEINGN